jgi:talin
MQQLEALGKGLKKTTDALVAVQSAALEQESSSVEMKTSFVKQLAQELDISEDVFAQERKLDAAKRALAKIRAAKYMKS